MYYEINVSKLNERTGRYHHFFATAERSCTNSWHFQKVLIAMKERFLEPEYRITATYCEKVIKSIDLIDGKED